MRIDTGTVCAAVDLSKLVEQRPMDPRPDRVRERLRSYAREVREFVEAWTSAPDRAIVASPDWLIYIYEVYAAPQESDRPAPATRAAA